MKLYSIRNDTSTYDSDYEISRDKISISFTKVARKITSYIKQSQKKSPLSFSHLSIEILKIGSQPLLYNHRKPKYISLPYIKYDFDRPIGLNKGDSIVIRLIYEVIQPLLYEVQHMYNESKYNIETHSEIRSSYIRMKLYPAINKEIIWRIANRKIAKISKESHKLHQENTNLSKPCDEKHYMYTVILISNIIRYHHTLETEALTNEEDMQ